MSEKNKSLPLSKLPKEVQEAREKIQKRDGFTMCNAKHPTADFWCWLEANHKDQFHTAGLEDWQ